MKKFLAYVMSALLLTACYDDSEMKSRLDKMDQRLTTVESQVASLNTQLTKLQGLMYGKWYVSYGHGVTYVECGKATGDDRTCRRILQVTIVNLQYDKRPGCYRKRFHPGLCINLLRFRTCETQTSLDQWFCIHVSRLRETHQLENCRSNVAEGAILDTLDLVAGIDNNELYRIQ